jgi:hypothetical protein
MFGVVMHVVYPPFRISRLLDVSASQEQTSYFPYMLIMGTTLIYYAVQHRYIMGYKDPEKKREYARKWMYKHRAKKKKQEAEAQK